jgi:glycolate oxidase
MEQQRPTQLSETDIEVLRLLTDRLGAKVLTDAQTLEAARTDRSGKVSQSRPLCVVEAIGTDDVVEVLKVASKTKTPVVTRGGGSGLAGGAIGSGGEIVLSLIKMNRILNISVADRLAHVESGVINQDLNLAAMQLGLWFTPDPASRTWSTVGGNIATNAGGLLCAKYGVTREAVRELTVVMADGSLLNLGHQTVKGVTGYDLVSLMVGSEGTLGVITEAKVALKPVDTNPVWTVSGLAKDIHAAGVAIQETISKGFQPSVFELIDARCSDYINQYLASERSVAPGDRLIVQTDGAGAKELAFQISKTWKDLGLEVEIETEGEKLMNFRRAMLPALEKRGKVLIEDVAVPISALAQMLLAIRQIEQDFDIEVPTVAHAGDGNLHPNFIYTESEVPERIWQAADQIFRKAIALGGTLTGEHGVGTLKSHWLKDELGQAQWELQWQLKKLFDPNLILNPGKVFNTKN